MSGGQSDGSYGRCEYCDDLLKYNQLDVCSQDCFDLRAE